MMKYSAQRVLFVGITKQTYSRWRKEFGALNPAQAKGLKELEEENSRLKQLAFATFFPAWLGALPVTAPKIAQSAPQLSP
jgi:hypothetical protein